MNDVRPELTMIDDRLERNTNVQARMTQPALMIPEALRANADARVPVVPTPRLKAGTEPVAHDFVRAVEPAAPDTPLAAVLDRFQAEPSLTAVPVIRRMSSPRMKP